MEDILLEHGQEKLKLFLAEINTVLILIILLTTLVFTPMKKGKKAKIDLRLITLFGGIFWSACALYVYPDRFLNSERILWLLVDIVVAIALVHLRCVILRRRSNGRCP